MADSPCCTARNLSPLSCRNFSACSVYSLNSTGRGRVAVRAEGSGCQENINWACR